MRNLTSIHYSSVCKILKTLFLGTGKSATIEAVATVSENILRNAAAGEDPNLPNVLLCAFTAKAANLIGE